MTRPRPSLLPDPPPKRWPIPTVIAALLAVAILTLLLAEAWGAALLILPSVIRFSQSNDAYHLGRDWKDHGHLLDFLMAQPLWSRIGLGLTVLFALGVLSTAIYLAAWGVG